MFWKGYGFVYKESLFFMTRTPHPNAKPHPLTGRVTISKKIGKLHLKI